MNSVLVLVISIFLVALGINGGTWMMGMSEFSGQSFLGASLLGFILVFFVGSLGKMIQDNAAESDVYIVTVGNQEEMIEVVKSIGETDEL